MLEISLPYNLDLLNTIKLIKEIDSQAWLYDKIILDCSNLSNVEPFSMVLLVSNIDRIRKEYPELKIKGRGPFKQYPAFMGLFYYLRITKNGYQGSYNKGNPRYSVIEKHSCQKIKDLAEENSWHFCDEVEEISMNLAKVLSRDSEDFFKTFSYSIREMLRNVLEHSESKNFYYCAQYWPSKDKVEIGIIDSGIGLTNSLNKNPDIEIDNDFNAINSALTPGVTSKKYGKGGPKSKWYNSGYGLYMTSRVCSEGGSFTILSGKNGIIKTRNRNAMFQCNHLGTGVRLIIKPSQIKNIEKKIDQYNEEADQIIKHNGGVPDGRSPSTILKIIKARK